MVKTTLIIIDWGKKSLAKETRCLISWFANAYVAWLPKLGDQQKEHLSSKEMLIIWCNHFSNFQGPFFSFFLVAHDLTWQKFLLWRYYALLTLRCILRGRAEAPQGIETCWFWLGRLGSLCFPMKIISWNVRGLGSRNKRRMVKDFLRSENPDVVMIQETKKENCDRRSISWVIKWYIVRYSQNKVF